MNNITVILSEEYGYRTWKWETSMTADELATWWQTLPTVNPYFFNPSGKLPGTMTRVQENHAPDSGDWTGHIHCDDDSYLCPASVTQIFHAGFKAFAQ